MVSAAVLKMAVLLKLCVSAQVGLLPSHANRSPSAAERSESRQEVRRQSSRFQIWTKDKDQYVQRWLRSTPALELRTYRGQLAIVL